jgi:hypothetical protein
MSERTARTVAAWVAGPVALVGFWVLLKTAGPSHSKWAPVYLAGAAGGLCFELIRNRWRTELPSGNKATGPHPESSFAPFGPLVDLAFFGRMFTGAVAAPTFLGLVNALNAPSGQHVTNYLTGVAGRSETIAWGVAVGFAAPAAWSMIEGFVKARGAAADARLEIQQKQLDLIKAKLAEPNANGTRDAEIAGLIESARVTTGS